MGRITFSAPPPARRPSLRCMWSKRCERTRGWPPLQGQVPHFGHHTNTPFGSACNHITNGGQVRSQYTARIIDIETRSMTDLVDWLTYSVSHAHQGVSCPREPPPIVRCQIARFRGDSSNSPNFFQPRTGCTCHVDKRRHQRRLRRFLSIPTGDMDHHRH